MKKTQDYLKKQETNVKKVASGISGAISMISNIIEALKNTNEGINASLTEISEYQAGLEVTANNLRDEKKKSEKLISNFEALIKTE